MGARTTELFNQTTFLAGGGTETYLAFEQGFPLRENCGFEVFENEPALRELERRYLEPIADAALAHGHGLLCDAIVWRASPDWFARLGYAPGDVERVNANAVRRTRATFESWRAMRGAAAADMPILVSGDVGPRGDGYRVERSGPTAEAALDYHRRQVEALARAGADLVCAMTMTHVEEAVGIALAAREQGLPAILSATVETDARMPDGSTIADFVRRVDDATGAYPLFYMVNCAHPTHVTRSLHDAVGAHADWLPRLRGFRANASAKSHAELDESPTLDRGDPADLAARVAELQRELGLCVVGGCCGTDAEHLRAIAAATTARKAA